MEASEFGLTVRRLRDRIAPESVGLPTGGRRRATGLRREELAGLASISVDYLTRLEQGRATSPSAQVVESLARALRLSDTEREHLFVLAGLYLPGHDAVSQRIPPSVQRLLDRLAVGLREAPDAAQLDVLTEREREVLRLVGHGLSNDEIAVELFLSPLTAKTHVSRILSKLQARDRVHLVVIAYETGLVAPGWR